MIYLDWNSYGLIAPEVLETMNTVWRNCYNPSSKHALGQKTKKHLLDLTSELKFGLNASNYEVVFTSGATEANTALLRMYSEVFVSDIEHPSIRACPHAQIIPVGSDAALDLRTLSEAIKETPFLTSYMLANHETGIINDLREAITITRTRGGFFHTDATQAFGRIDLNLNDLDADYVTIAPHKCGGPIGIGALLYKKGAPMPNFSWGNAIRIGTPAVPLIAGMVASLSLPKASNAWLEAQICSNIVGKHLPRLPNTTCITHPNKTAFLMAADLNNIFISSGSACTSADSDRTASAYAMGITEDTVRISSGCLTTEEDFATIARFIKEWKEFD